MAKELCPSCGARRVRVSSMLPAHYDISFDLELQALVVVSERLDEPDWDETSSVSCPECGWSGQLGELC